MPDELQTPSSVVQYSPAAQDDDERHTAPEGGGGAGFCSQPLYAMSVVQIRPSGEHALGPKIG